jgi:hypothetical protein
MHFGKLSSFQGNISIEISGGFRNPMSNRTISGFDLIMSDLAMNIILISTGLSI